MSDVTRFIHLLPCFTKHVLELFNKRFQLGVRVRMRMEVGMGVGNSATPGLPKARPDLYHRASFPAPERLGSALCTSRPHSSCQARPRPPGQPRHQARRPGPLPSWTRSARRGPQPLPDRSTQAAAGAGQQPVRVTGTPTGAAAPGSGPAGAQSGSGCPPRPGPGTRGSPAATGLGEGPALPSGGPRWKPACFVPEDLAPTRTTEPPPAARCQAGPSLHGAGGGG